MSKILQQFKVIGQIQSTIAKADNLDQAFKESLHIIIDNCSAEYAVIWFCSGGNSKTLRPYYWLCPYDLTSLSHKIGNGIVGRAFENSKSIRLLDYQNAPKEEKDKDFKELDIGSLICVPFDLGAGACGCVEIFNTTAKEKFTEEEADICEILTLMIETGLKENDRLLKPVSHGKKIMTVQNVTREFQNGDYVTRVLKGVNLDVYEGEFLVLLGESGCGKSTLLNIIGGMDQATSGTVKFMDQEITNATQDELTKFRRDNIGFIFQSYNLMPNLNAVQNLDLIAELVDNPMPSLDALELVGLGQKTRSYPSMLSGGQQQRISIARALVKNPKLILADEPTAALDYTTSIEVLQVLEKIVKKGTTLVMVTHNEEITRMANRVIRFRDGLVYEVTVNRAPVHAEALVW